MKKLLFSFIAVAFIVTNVPAANASKVSASWYDCSSAGQCSKNKRTSSGERFNPNALTAAHKTLPFGTRVKITYRGKSVIVRINDRGPFVKGRSIDLSRAAARKIGCHGVCVVHMQVL